MTLAMSSPCRDAGSTMDQQGIAWLEDVRAIGGSREDPGGRSCALVMPLQFPTHRPLRLHSGCISASTLSHRSESSATRGFLQDSRGQDSLDVRRGKPITAYIRVSMS